jgi:hypothetical protein
LIIKEFEMKTNSPLILRIALGIALLLLAVFSALPLIPPRAVSADAPAKRFSAERAMSDLEVIASEPHGAGSDAQARVREYFVKQIGILGLQAEIKTSGQLSNIFILIPGTDSTGTVLVTGHYDSHPPAPGAGDDGISVAAMLEAIRVLHASPPLRNNLLFLFTDGEELSYLGTYAYLHTYPEAKNELDVILCFDARPDNGPLALWETSPGDAWLVRQMTGLPLSLWAGSWTNREERGEIDTDCSVFFAAGFSGVEIENAEKGIRYHTPRDTVDAISPNLMQAYGKTMLVLTNHFGTVDLRTQVTGSDLDYFTLPLVGMVAYPGWVMPVLSGLGLLSLPGFVVIAWRRGSFSPGRFGWSLLGLLLGIVLIALCAQLAWGGVKNMYSDERAAGIGFEASTAWLTGMMFAAILLMIILLILLSRRLGAINLVPAAAILYLLVWFAVHLLMDADDPFTTAYIAWPLLGGVVGMGVLLFARNPIWKTVLLALCALVVMALLVPQLWLATYTRNDAWIPILAACIPLGFFAPQVESVFGLALKAE